AARLLSTGVEWDAIVPLPSARASQFKNGQRLSPADLAAVRAGGTWTRIVNPSRGAGPPAVLEWCLAVELLGLLAFPLTAAVFRDLPDRGWLLSKTLGVLGVSYVAWLGAGLRWWIFDRHTLLWICGVLLAAAVWRRRRRQREPIDRTLLAAEQVLFWVAFGAFLVVRSGNPDLWFPNFGG